MALVLYLCDLLALTEFYNTQNCARKPNIITNMCNKNKLDEGKFGTKM